MSERFSMQFHLNPTPPNVCGFSRGGVLDRLWGFLTVAASDADAWISLTSPGREA
jgi:hypothetical protein